MPSKRKSVQVDDAEPPTRSTRQKASSSQDVTSARESTPKKKIKSEKKPKNTSATKSKDAKEGPASEVVNSKKTSKKTAQVKKETGSEVKSKAEVNGPAPATGRQYWLMKAEPETRFEKGIDVRFSIDDLAAKTEPEPWDGIRNFVARNNLRAMKQGDLAFFYHSNCKEPGIAGTMEVVQEHSPDLSAHDPKAPYYDPKSKPEDPKWSVVHVKFHSKFDEPIFLKELREMGALGKPLENMQMLKQSRLSVSKVSEAEWEYLNGVAAGRAKKA